MSAFDKIIEVATGGLGAQVVDLVKSYFPPDMNAEQKAQAEIALNNLMFEREKAAMQEAATAQQEFDTRIRDLEGTATDLKAVPFIGPLMLFIRGAQRPVIGYATMYLDYCVFSGMWNISANAQLTSAFWIINVLVLGFLFGERAIQNVLPLVTQFLAARGK